MSEQVSTFEHVNLNEVDPASAPFVSAAYTLQLMDVEKKAYVSGPDTKNPGVAGEYIQLVFAIAESPDFSGRRIYETMFPGNGTNKRLRRMADASGFSQDDGQSVFEFLVSMKDQQARFVAPISEVERLNKKTNVTKKALAVNLWECSPVG